jgi:o-succinylbenzoate synthase
MLSWKSANPTSNGSSGTRDALSLPGAMKLSLRRVSGRTAGAQSAQRAWSSRSGLLLELCVGSARGLGEASPLPGFSADTIESAESALGALDLAALERALNLDADVEVMLRAVADLVPEGQPASRMALETAALDLRGQQTRRSASALLGADPGTTRALAWLVGAPEAQAFDAIQRGERAGYRHFKLKLGRVGNLESELAGVHALRYALGTGPRLRLDVNRAWSQAEANSACRKLEALDIEFLEEPSAVLTRPLDSAIPIALDESLRGLKPGDLAALVRNSGACFVVLKPMMLGGLSHCLTLARLAIALNLGVIVSHSFDGPVALTAAAALALSLPGRTAQGLGPHPGLTAWPQLPLPIMHGMLHAWTAPGLGIASRQLN